MPSPAPESKPVPTEAPKPGQSVHRVLLGAAAAVIVIGGIHAAASLITQLLIIAILVIALSPLYYGMVRRFRFPSWLAVTLLIAVLVGSITYAITVPVPRAVMDLSRNIHGYQKELTGVAESATRWLQARDVEIADETLPNLVAIDKDTLTLLGKKSAAKLGTFTQNAVLILIIVSFFLAELPKIPGLLDKARWMTPARRDLANRFVADVRHYLGIKTVISAATGIFIYLGLKVIGVPSAGLFGFLAFLLNYVPAIGSIVAAVPAVLLALSVGGGAMVLWTVVLYVVVNQILGNILEPRIMGSGFGVSPIVVLFSVLFWGWVLGPIGMLFAVPLSMAVRGALADA